MESKIGRDERGERNNHGTFFDAQAASLALFVGDSALARALIGESGRSRIASQIDAEGKQALEIARTRPFHYSVFNLDAFTMLAEMGRHVNVDSGTTPRRRVGASRRRCSSWRTDFSRFSFPGLP